jgi:hypothetical protein
MSKELEPKLIIHAKWKLLIAVTIINVLVATGYSIAGIIVPQSILPNTVIPNKASFIFALYAGARTIPLAVIAIYSIIVRNKTSIISLGILAGFVQFIDGFIGIYQQDIMKSAGPFFVSLIQFAALIWVWKTDKNN